MRKFLLIAAIAFAGAACDDHDHGDDHDHDHDQEGLDAHACEHVTAGPYASVTAAADLDSAVEGFEAHHLVTVDLVTLDSGSKGGFVKITVPDAGAYRIMLNADVPAMLHTADNMHMDWASSGAPDGCDPAAKTYQTVDLEANTSYLLIFGPTDADSVAFVMEKGGEGHEGHDHEGEGHDHEGDDHDHEGEGDGHDHEGEGDDHDHEGEGDDHEGEGDGHDHEGEGDDHDHEGEGDDHEGEGDDHDHEGEDHEGEGEDGHDHEGEGDGHEEDGHEGEGDGHDHEGEDHDHEDEGDGGSDGE